MFRKSSPVFTEESSFSSGKASIILENESSSSNHQYMYESEPYPYQYQYGDNLNRPLPPTPSLERTSTQTTSSSCFSLTEDDCSNSNKNDEPLTLESMSAVIAAAVQMSSGGIKSSLSMGHASIKQPQQPQQEKVKRRFSLFSWKKQQQQQQHQQPPLTNVSPRSSCSTVVVVDDGRDELAYRGIHIKEIKTTLKPMVIPSNVSHPMPTVTMKRPGFARINY